MGKLAVSAFWPDFDFKFQHICYFEQTFRLLPPSSFQDRLDRLWGFAQATSKFSLCELFAGRRLSDGPPITASASMKAI